MARPAPSEPKTRWWLVLCGLILIGVAFVLGRHFRTQPPGGSKGNPTPPVDGVGVPQAQEPRFDFNTDGPVSALAFNPKDSSELSWGTTDGRRRIVSLLPDSGANQTDLPRLELRIDQVTFSPDGRLWGTLSDGQVYFFDARKKPIDVTRELPLFRDSDYVLGFAFDPTNQWIATTVVDSREMGAIRILNVKAAKIVSFEGKRREVSAMAFAASGKLLAVGNESGFVTRILLDDPTYETMKLDDLPSTRHGFSAVVGLIPIDGDDFAVVCGRDIVRCGLRNGTSKKGIYLSKEKITAVAQAGDKGDLVVASGTTVTIVDWQTGEVKKTFESNAGIITAVAVNESGTLVAAGTEEAKVLVWALK